MRQTATVVDNSIHRFHSGRPYTAPYSRIYMNAEENLHDRILRSDTLCYLYTSGLKHINVTNVHSVNVQ